MKTIILSLVFIFDMIYNIYQKALKPMFYLFLDMLKLVYEHIAKFIFTKVVKPSYKYLCEKYDNFNKDEFRNKLLEHKNTFLSYFKDQTFEQVVSKFKLDCKLVYLVISTIVKERLKTNYLEEFKVHCFYNNEKTLVTIMSRNNIETTCYFTLKDNEIVVTYNITEHIPVEDDIENSHINGRIYSN